MRGSSGSRGSQASRHSRVRIGQLEVDPVTFEEGLERIDVLRSQPLVLAADQRMTPADVEAIHGVASRYYRLIIMDSGNDESAERWLRMARDSA